MTTAKRILVVCRRPPYGESFGREALDMAMAAAAFDQRVALLFLGDGALQLVAGQQAAAIGQKALDKQLSALPLYDVTELYIDAEALRRRGLADAELALPATALEPAAIAALLATQDVVLGF